MRTTVIFTVFIAGLLLVGCAQGSDNKKKPDPTKAFIGGTTGLNTYLLEGLPPSTVQDNGQFPFSFGVVVENKGEADVGPNTSNPYVNVTLVGVSENTWNVTNTSAVLNQPLRGARKNFDGTVLPGELTTFTFEGLNYMQDLRGNTQFTLRARVCYDYSTVSTTKLCVKDDVLENINDQSICSLQGEKNPSNSGGPVHVTSLVQNPMASDKIQFNFVVEHVGQGTIYKRVNGSSCDPSVSNLQKNYVEVFVKPFSSRWDIECGRLNNNNVGTIRLHQGAPQTISCTMEREAPSQGRIYQPVLEIVLRYRYGQFIETPILVQDVTNSPDNGSGFTDSDDNSSN